MPRRPLRIGIVGRGRMGRSLARAWRSAGHALVLRAHGDPRALAADAVLLAVPDDAIPATARAWAARLRPGALVFHAAGATSLDALCAARDAGLRVGSLHPMAAVATPFTSLRGAWAAVDGDPAVRRTLNRLARDAGMRPFPAPPADRIRYHLGAVLAANSQVPLLEAALAQLTAAGVAPAAARQALAHLAHGAIDAWLRRGGPEGLTGPVARGDAATVRRHLEALRSSPPDRALYAVLARAALALARERSHPGDLRALGQVLVERGGPSAGQRAQR